MISRDEEKNQDSHKRPYTLGKRQEGSDRRREQVLQAARKLLESGGYLSLTMEILAKESGISRQTVHNLFQTKAGVLEALFDQLALCGGMDRMGEVMRTVMMGTDATAMVEGYVRVFAGFWGRDRLLLRKIRGIAAFDPELGAVLETRNQRRRISAPLVVERLAKLRGASFLTGQAGGQTEGLAWSAAALYAMTSFEYFDVLAEAIGSEAAATEALVTQVKALLLDSVAIPTKPSS